jgi:uncharacterized repeat protein (TIGR01451 family)
VNRGGTVNLAVGGSATYTAVTTLSSGASGTLSNTASVAAPAGFTDPNTLNNSATDSDPILLNANLSISKTDNVSGISAGGTVTYVIAVGNSGPNNVTGAQVTDNFPAAITGATWTCSASGGSSCGGPSSGSGNISRAVNVQNGGTVTFTVNAAVSASATGSFTNTATVTAPAGINDTNLTNNTASDTDSIVGSTALPSMGLLDNFNRGNSNTLNNGSNWSQIVLLGNAAIRVDSNRAFAAVPGWAMWNNPTGGYGAQQGATFTFINTSSLGGSTLLLKGSGGSATTPQNYIRVTYNSGAVVVSTTINTGGTLVQRATFPITFATGDTMSATAYGSGNVYVYKNGTFVGVVAIPTSGPGAWTQGSAGGRIGILLPTNARVDDFSGGTLP